MAFYESTFIARQDLSRQDVSKLMDSFAGIIKEKGGKVVKSEYWGLRNLAYKINKNGKGHYAMIASDAPPAAILEMERVMGINEDIVRKLSVRVEEIDEAPSAILQKNSREDATEETAA